MALYTYVANSPLVGQADFNNGGSVHMTTVKEYDYLNRLKSISSVTTGGTALPITFTYSYNDANQRTRRADVDGSYWVYNYDTLGQVTAGKKYWADGTPVAGQQFEYTFDDIGNRQTTKSGGDENGANLRLASYTANNLNQYTSRGVPGYVDILGLALATNTVTVNGTTAYRKGEYFRNERSVNNSSTALWTNIIVAATGETSVTGNVFVAKSPEAFGYDLDGNLTNDGRWVFTWDAENRLTQIESLTNGPTASKRRVTWQYDGKGRRLRQTTYDLSSGSAVVTEDLKFVNDGWRCLAELNGTNNALVRRYTWGLDLSGSMDGAGGVGGLLWLKAGPAPQFCAYDGNGNVAGLVRGSTGDQTAAYEYDPFGRTIRMTGVFAQSNPFRFSTKRANDTTDLVLYEYRAYNPSTGRWLSRDPVGESGGLNVSAVVMNDVVLHVDALGLQGCITCPVVPLVPQQPPGLPPMDNNSDAGWPGAIDNAANWVLGQEGDTAYGPDSPESKQMSQSGIAAKLRKYYTDKFKNKPCSDWGSVTGFAGKFRIKQFVADLPNGTAHFVGSASGEAHKTDVDLKQCKATVRFKLTNTTSLTSLLYGIWPESLNVTTPGAPFANWTQTYDGTRRLIASAVFCLLFTFTSCHEPQRDLVGGFRLERFDEGGKAYYVVSPGQKLEAGGVFDGETKEIGWNEKAILARVSRLSSTDTNGWYVLDIRTRKVEGPLIEAEVRTNSNLNNIRCYDPAELF